MSVSKKERAKDAHMGPGESFPVGPAGQHLKAAWDLAGHAADPDEVRSNILRFAHEHGLMAHLPEAAKEHAEGMSKKALLVVMLGTVAKAKGSDMAALYSTAMEHADLYGYASGMSAPNHMHRSILEHAAETGNQDKLPESAHSMMHQLGMRHSHEGIDQDDEGEAGTYDGAGHVHTVSKAFSAPTSVIQKAWLGSDGETYIEGWVSTEDQDLQKDIVPPEAFRVSLDDYFALGAPVSSEHNTDALPIGHLQQAALVRDGEVFQSAKHPTDAAEFEHFPGTGTGVWARAKVTEATTGAAIKSGNVRGFSWIGLPTKTTRLAGGGRRFEEVKPLIETTVAAYPVNQKAAIMAAKARPVGRQTENEMDLEKMLAEAVQAVVAKSTVSAPATETATVDARITSLEEKLAAAVAAMEKTVETVSKAFIDASREGVGRKGVVTPTDEFESDPAGFLARKGMPETDAEKIVATAIFKSVISDGMRD